MKYKLKKDLPFASAGTEVRKHDLAMTSERPQWMWTVVDSEGNHYRVGTQDTDMTEWIEEVKPRERYMLEGINPIVTWTEQEKDEELGRNPTLKFFKLREVI